MYAELQAKHYAWERAIWSQLSAADQRRVEELRRKLEESQDPGILAQDVSNISNEILTLSRSATEKLEP